MNWSCYLTLCLCGQLAFMPTMFANQDICISDETLEWFRQSTENIQEEIDALQDEMERSSRTKESFEILKRQQTTESMILSTSSLMGIPFAILVLGKTGRSMNQRDVNAIMETIIQPKATWSMVQKHLMQAGQTPIADLINMRKVWRILASMHDTTMSRVNKSKIYQLYFISWLASLALWITGFKMIQENLHQRDAVLGKTKTLTMHEYYDELILQNHMTELTLRQLEHDPNIVKCAKK